MTQRPDPYSIEQLGLAGLGAAVVVLSLRWLSGVVARDNSEREEARHALRELRAELATFRVEAGHQRDQLIKCEVERVALERRVAELERQVNHE